MEAPLLPKRICGIQGNKEKWDIMFRQKRVVSVCTAAAAAISAVFGIMPLPFVPAPEPVSAQSAEYECLTPPDGYDQERLDTAKGKVTEITYHSEATHSDRTALVYTPQDIPVSRNMQSAIFCTASTETAATGWQAGTAEPISCWTI